MAMRAIFKLAVCVGTAAAAVATLTTRDYPSDDPLTKCPGYKAANVKTSKHALTADLTLAGDACNVYGDDLKSLTLTVTYETSTF